jgi:hypothetical protein
MELVCKTPELNPLKSYTNVMCVRQISWPVFFEETMNMPTATIGSDTIL